MIGGAILAFYLCQIKHKQGAKSVCLHRACGDTGLAREAGNQRSGAACPRCRLDSRFRGNDIEEIGNDIEEAGNDMGESSHGMGSVRMR